MTVKEFLKNETWTVTRVNGKERKFMGDSAFGPLWKDFPKDVEVPPDLTLNSMKEVFEYINIKMENVVFDIREPKDFLNKE